MNFEVYDISVNDLGCDRVATLFKRLLNKLHTYQDFCAKEEVTININNIDYTFKLVKRRYLNVNNEDFKYLPYNMQIFLTEQCPCGNFISQYNIELRDFIQHNYLDTGKVMRKVDNDFYKDITYGVEPCGFDYNINDTYIMLEDVNIINNRVTIVYTEINIYGNNWDNITINDSNRHTAVIQKSWMKSDDAIGFETKEQLYKDINLKTKEALFKFSQDIHDTLKYIKKFI